MHDNSVLYAVSGTLRGGGNSWRVYYALIAQEATVLLARNTIAKMFEVGTTAVQRFIVSHSLPTFEVRLLHSSRKKQILLTPLSTAVFYWKHLYANRQLSHLPQRTNERWKKFMAYCETLKPAEFLPDMRKLVPGSERPCTPDYEFEFVHSCALLECPIESLGILDVVIDKYGQYWISQQSGLSVIDVPLGWLDNELKRSVKKNRILQQRGFLGRYCQHFCKVSPGDLRWIATLPFEDWLAIWAYFALHQNQKALALLKLLAQKSIEPFLNQILIEDFLREIRLRQPVITS